MIHFLSRWVTANQLTIIRIVMIPVIFLLTRYNTEWSLLIAAGLFTLACITDYLDGILARHTGEETRLGKLLDPVADKILVTAMLVILVFHHRVLPTIAALLIAREFAVSGLRSIAASEGVLIEASQGAKLKTATQMFALGFLTLHYPLWGFLFG